MRRRLLGVLLPISLVLAGCAAPSDLSDDAAVALQAAVLDLHRAAAEERYDAAGTAATEVRAALDAAAEAGEVSVARYRQIDSALTATEEELAAVADPVGEEPTADEDPRDEEGASDISVPADDDEVQAPATTPAPAPAVEDEASQEDVPAPERGNGGGTGGNGRDSAPGQQKVPPGQEKGPGKGP